MVPELPKKAVVGPTANCWMHFTCGRAARSDGVHPTSIAVAQLLRHHALWVSMLSMLCCEDAVGSTAAGGKRCLV